MIDLPWAQNGCFAVITAVQDTTRNMHCRGSPIVSLLQSIETERVMQDVVFVSQVVQPLTTPITFFTIQIDRAKEPRSRLSRG